MIKTFKKFSHKFRQKNHNVNYSAIGYWIIISIGIVLRLRQYVFNRSLWHDEARNALNIVNQSLLELIEKGTYTAPVGFLIVEKMFIQIFNNSDYIFRLFPLLCSIISLFLFYRLAEYFLKTNSALLALALFAISNNLIYFSSEVKQFSSDVAVTLLLYITFFHIESKKLNPLSIALFGIVGGIAIWFSHPAVFILAGFGISLSLIHLYRQDFVRIGRLAIVYLIWVISFSAWYLFIYIERFAQKSAVIWWTSALMPFPPSNFSDLMWFYNTFWGIFKNPDGFLLTIPPVLCFITGSISMFLKKRNVLFILISPIFVTLLASGLQKYPFPGNFLLYGVGGSVHSARTMLFIVPVLLLIIAEGAKQIYRNSKLMRSVLIGLILIQPLYTATYHFAKPRTYEEIKPLIIHFKKHQKPEDLLYVYWGSADSFQYYAKKYGVKKDNYILGAGGPYLEELNKLHGNKRVWILFSHIHPSNQKNLILNLLDILGTKIDSFKAPGAEIFLYNLTGKKKLNVVFSPLLYHSNGLYPDGIWTKGDATISRLKYQIAKNDKFLVLSTKGFNPFRNDIEKLGLEIYVNSDRLELFLRKGKDFYYKLDEKIKTISEIRIISSTFVPKELRINEDSRRLGIDIAHITIKSGIEFWPWETWTGEHISGWPRDIPIKFRWTASLAAIDNLNELKNHGPFFFMCAHPDISSDPVVVKILGDNNLIKQFLFADHKWKKVVFGPDELKGSKKLTIQVSRTWNPKVSGYSEDDRDLGVAVAVPELGH